MAKSSDTPTPQMLFSEFDLSDKGRHGAIANTGAAPAAIAPLPSLADLAASLELDFEDDSDSPSTQKKAAEHNAKGESNEHADPQSDQQDEQKEHEKSDDAHSRSAQLQPIEPPTWEEFASGFRKNPRSSSWNTLAESNEKAPNKATDSGQLPPGSTTDILPNPAQYAATSILDDAMGAADFGLEQDKGTTTILAADEITSSEKPTDVFVREEDIPSEQKTTVHDSGPDDSEFDILFSLDQNGDLDFSEAMESRDRYPREESGTDSSGGEQWFEPPEEAPNQHKPLRVTNWYEPPKEDIAFVDHNEGEPATEHSEQHQLPAESGQRGTTSRRTTRASGRRRSGDTAIRMFSDVDAQEAWSDKLESFDKEIPGWDSEGDSETGNVDFFSGLDLDSIWEEKSRENKASRSTLGADSLVSPESTVILDQTLLADWMGGEFPGEEIPDWLTSIDRVEKEQDESGSVLDDPFEDIHPAQSEEDDALISDLESFLDSNDTQSHLVGVQDTPESTPVPEDIESGRGTDETDADEFAEDDSQGELKSPDSPESFAENAEAEERDDLDSADESSRDLSGLDNWQNSRKSDPLEGYDPSRGGKQDALSEEDNFSETGIAEEEENAGAGLTTDDLLNDIDFDDETINGDVSAPVVNDSDIDMPSRRLPRPGTEEMQAIIKENEFSDSDGEASEAGGGEDGEGGAEEEAGPPADEVAVNPMDVFANMDDMDFSDDFDDDMRSMLEDDEEEEGEDLNIDVDGFTDPQAAMTATKSDGWRLLAKYYAIKMFYKIIPARYVEKFQAMIAWGDNWWFYCDLLAAVIASASLAVIVSYYLWYRD